MSERQHPPHGTPASRGRVGTVSFETARALKEVLSNHPQLKPLECTFTAGEELVKEGIVSAERYGYYVIEGTLSERQSRYVPDHGWITCEICEIPPWSIGFDQALSLATVRLPAKVSLVAKTDGRAFQIDADWLTNFSKIDKVGLMTAGMVMKIDQLTTALVEERLPNQINHALRKIAAVILARNPDTRYEQEDLVKILGRKIIDNHEEIKRLTQELEALKHQLVGAHEIPEIHLTLPSEIPAPEPPPTVKRSSLSGLYQAVSEDQDAPRKQTPRGGIRAMGVLKPPPSRRDSVQHPIVVAPPSSREEEPDEGDRGTQEYQIFDPNKM